MDLSTGLSDPLAFHLSGRCRGSGLQPVAGLGLRPALLAPYRDLAMLRHDFPLVLVDGDGPDFVQSLSTLVDGVIHDVAPRGPDGERMRRHALQLEREIRHAVAHGGTGTLATLWDQAAARLGAREGDTLEQVLVHAGGALRAGGEVLGCGANMPAQLLTHAWRAEQRRKAHAFHLELSTLVLKLSDILRAADSHSQAGRQPQALAAALGTPHHAQFDFSMLSRIVGKGAPRDELPAARRQRISDTLQVLESQRFFAPAGGSDAGLHRFLFDHCDAAALAFRERLGEAAALVKALAVARLETKGRYDEADHGAFFDNFDAHTLTAEDLTQLPDYLVCIAPDRSQAPENASLMQLLSAGLPVKVLVQITELLENETLGDGRFAFGVRSARLATTAMGLGGMFVLQAASANLVALRQRVARGMACHGPALFSVYVGCGAAGSALPPYLDAAAAMQSRAFPAFSYDAAAGANWATRFSLENNPAAQDDWAAEALVYADTAQQRQTTRCTFTPADFMLCDPRRAGHFALITRAQWTAALLPAHEWLALDEAEAARRVPYVLAVDDNDALHRVVVDARLMQTTRRCLLLWRRLQEHGGVHDSHAQRLLAADRAARLDTPGPDTGAAASAAALASGTTEIVGAPTANGHTHDEAWIDSTRCPSCNECQLINDHMFAYDDRKQAYIKDLSAGTYKQLVEAAESCQVAIIHPGKPRDPKEPGLEALLVRAEPFR